MVVPLGGNRGSAYDVRVVGVRILSAAFDMVTRWLP
jgi:hypothetical protein